MNELYLELFPIKGFYLFCDGAPFVPFNVNPLLENGGDARRASVRLDKPKSMQISIFTHKNFFKNNNLKYFNILCSFTSHSPQSTESYQMLRSQV